jgi:hypothetical protein
MFNGGHVYPSVFELLVSVLKTKFLVQVSHKNQTINLVQTSKNINSKSSFELVLTTRPTSDPVLGNLVWNQQLASS